MNEIDFSKIPEWLALLGGMGREVWAWFVQGWSMSVGPLLAVAPEWVIGLVVLVVVVVVLRAAGVLR